jgi:circadian clock protein KaiC
LSGGLTSGTVTFLSGPTGVGKTTTGLQFLQAAADEGTHSVLYSFEEGRRTLIDRAEAVNIPVTDSIAEGLVTVEEIAPDELSLDQFTHRIRTAVGDDEAGVVMIDGVSGYRRAFERADEPMRELLKIGRYLRNMNVTGIITNEVHQITGSFRVTEQNVSHLADNIIVLRHLEHDSELRKVIGVLKMRTNNFENTLRTFAITEDGLTIGEPLTGLRGILTGTADRTDEFE